MKVIFLDFDGPICTLHSYAEPCRPRDRFAWPPCVQALNRITDTTGAQIVVSSMWRYGGEEHVRNLLAGWGVTGKVIGITPRLEQRRGQLFTPVERGHEIAAWLRNQQVESYVILDDDDDMAHLKTRLIQTLFEDGLTEADADRAIAMLEQ